MSKQPGHGLLIVERILRDRGGIWRQIHEERDLKPLTLQMLASSVVSLAIYGAVLGASNGLFQAISSTLKLPLLFLATLLICLPTLYLFNLVFGARLSVAQAVALIMVAITVIAVLTLAFAPISLFFLITAKSYSFFKLLNVAILLLTSVVGLRFLAVGMSALNRFHTDDKPAVLPTQPTPAPVQAPPAQATRSNGGGAESATATATLAPVWDPAVTPLPVQQPRPLPEPARTGSMNLLYIWILVFGFVGTQLAWTLRPFFGSPGEPFEVFRTIEGTFYADVFRTIGHLLGGG